MNRIFLTSKNLMKYGPRCRAGGSRSLWRWFGFKVPKGIDAMPIELSEKNLRKACDLQIKRYAKKPKKYELLMEGVQEYLDENNWTLDTTKVLKNSFKLTRRISDTQVTVLSRPHNIHSEKYKHNLKYIREAVLHQQQDFITTTQIDQSPNPTSEDYAMNSEFLVEIRNVEKDYGGLLMRVSSLEGEVSIVNAFRMQEGMDLEDGDFVNELLEKYVGVEVSMLEPNFGICLYEYLRIHGVDEVLVMAVEGLCVSLEDQKEEYFLEGLKEFLEDD